MKAFGFGEQIPKKTTVKSEISPEVTLSETEADRLLEELLEQPENTFLLENEVNRKVVEESDSAIEAYLFAKKRIAERAERTLDFRVASEVEGIKITDVSYEGLLSTVQSIMKNAEEIGRGGDAYVVIDRTEIRNLPPEICYKIATRETTPRGRNSAVAEVAIQEKAFTAMNSISESKIGVPAPFYSLEIGGEKIIAMEKLNAKSVDDIKRGFGGIPRWFDIDAFCDELKSAIDQLHKKGLYHRDMHIGNIMITQSPEMPENAEKWGYIIDFGLSGEGVDGVDPYRKEFAGETFTYSDDYGIISQVRDILKSVQQRIRV